MADSIVEYETVTLYGRSFQNVPLIESSPTAWSYNPVRPRPPRFGLFPVRSPLLRESLLFSFPEGTKMFQFPSLASRLAG